MRKLEYCCKCGGETGRAGVGDDSIYIGGNGPFCQFCCDAMTSNEEQSVSKRCPIEQKIEDALNDSGIIFYGENQNGNHLDFHLPCHGVFIEAKGGATPRLLKQLKSAHNVIVVQGEKSADFLVGLLRLRALNAQLEEDSKQVREWLKAERKDRDAARALNAQLEAQVKTLQTIRTLDGTEWKDNKQEIKNLKALNAQLLEALKRNIRIVETLQAKGASRRGLDEWIQAVDAAKNLIAMAEKEWNSH